jgi:hypothetical protein
VHDEKRHQKKMLQLHELASITQMSHTINNDNGAATNASQLGKRHSTMAE